MPLIFFPNCAKSHTFERISFHYISINASHHINSPKIQVGTFVLLMSIALPFSKHSYAVKNKYYC